MRPRYRKMTATAVSILGILSSVATSPVVAAPTVTPTAYKNGTYTGTTVAAGRYGPVQIAVTITKGRITKIIAKKLPSRHPESKVINRNAVPVLVKEALTAQSARIAAVSGASLTSSAFTRSLASALTKAQ